MGHAILTKRFLGHASKNVKKHWLRLCKRSNSFSRQNFYLWVVPRNSCGRLQTKFLKSMKCWQRVLKCLFTEHIVHEYADSLQLRVTSLLFLVSSNIGLVPLCTENLSPHGVSGPTRGGYKRCIVPGRVRVGTLSSPVINPKWKPV